MPRAQFSETAPDEMPQASALLTLETSVEDGWIDYNDHMTEWQYYKVLADAGDNFLRAADFTEQYRLSGFSFFSVDGRLRNLHETRLGTALRVYTDILGFDSLRLHIYQYVQDVARNLTVATGEHMMIHVNTSTRKAASMLPHITQGLIRAYNRWKPVLRPKGLGAPMKPPHD